LNPPRVKRPLAVRLRVGDRNMMLVKFFCVLLIALPLNGAQQVLFQETFDQDLSERWRPVKFKGTTDYRIIPGAEGAYLQASARGTASGLGAELKINPEGKMILSWRWKIDQIPPGGTDTQIKTFDHTARLFVAFKSLIGPPRTVNYVWGNDLKIGQTYHHPNSGRARFIVLQQGNARAGEWIQESRDILADWRLLFGNDDPPQIVGIGLMTDSDGTESSITGAYDDIRLTLVKRENVAVKKDSPPVGSR
jgi:hypothetical protein